MKMFNLLRNKKLLFTVILGSSAIAIAGLSNPYFDLFIPVLFVFAMLEGLGNKKIVRLAVESLPLLFFIVALVLSMDLFYLLMNLLMVIMISKSILPKKRLDYFELFVVAFMIVILSSVSTISIIFSVLLFALFVSGAFLLIYS
ncbi:MAG: hypothetical protein ACP5GW_05260, partial [Caldisericaceae bacterium]